MGSHARVDGRSVGSSKRLKASVQRQGSRQERLKREKNVLLPFASRKRESLERRISFISVDVSSLDV
jgi:hypothetical protein